MQPPLPLYLIQELNWMPLKLHFKSKKASFMHKVHNNAVPESIREIFSVNGNQRYLANRMQTTFLKRVI
jgi:hypothetical protein